MESRKEKLARLKERAVQARQQNIADLSASVASETPASNPGVNLDGTSDSFLISQAEGQTVFGIQNTLQPVDSFRISHSQDQRRPRPNARGGPGRSFLPGQGAG
ncbi:unnamed protein product, partial [Heterosigma akashiwo]